MALQWHPKAASDVAERIWTPKAGECPASCELTVSTGSATLTTELQGEDVVALVTGGTAGITQIIAASAVLGNGETITETIYLPVLQTGNALAKTGQDITSSVLRPIVGVGNLPDSAETDLALEHLNEMLAAWARQGADMGVPLPVTTSTVFYCPDAEIAAIKANLTLRVRPEFLDGWMPTPLQVNAANRGLQLVKTARLPDERAPDVYY